MDQEVWLKPNRRALAMTMVIPLLSGMLAAWVAWRSDGSLRWLSMSLSAVAVALVIALVLRARRPRLAVYNGQLLLYLKWGSPLAVPLSIVECIFLGRPETQQSLGHTSRMVCLVIRLAEAATDYRQRMVKPALGRWEEGYITVSGAWCEPLTLELAQKLNDKLREAQRALKDVPALN